MRWRGITLLVLVLVLVLVTETQCLLAAENNDADNAGSSLKTVRQKLQLVKSLLAESAALARASRSDDPSVKEQAAAAHTLYDQAEVALNAEDAAQAGELLDESLQLIENATHWAPDPIQAKKKQLAHYTELLEGVHSLIATYQDLQLRLSPNATSASREVTAHASDLAVQAEALARNGHYPEASDTLQNAHTALITALNKLLASTTLMYDLQFKSPIEEFDYEIARYHSYEELVPIAYAELHPGEDNIKLSERFVQESREMKERAKYQAANGDHQAAIATMLNAVKQIQAALRLVGLVLPE